MRRRGSGVGRDRRGLPEPLDPFGGPTEVLEVEAWQLRALWVGLFPVEVAVRDLRVGQMVCGRVDDVEVLNWGRRRGAWLVGQLEVSLMSSPGLVSLADRVRVSGSAVVSVLPPPAGQGG